MSAPDVHAPSQLPDLRLWLADQWRPGRTFYTAAAPLLDGRGTQFGHRPDPANYARWEHDALRAASLWWIGPDMVDLLLATAAGVPDDAMIADLRPPYPAGLVVFAKPWRGLDSNDPTHHVEVDAMVWAPSLIAGHRCLAISSYRRLDFGMGMGPEETQLAVATGALDHGDRKRIGTWETRDGQQGVHLDGSAAAKEHAQAVVEHGTAMYPLADFADGEIAYSVTGVSWAPLGRSDWIIDQPISSRPWRQLTDGAHASYVEDRKVLAALWALLGLPGVASQTEERIDRQAMRRTERAGIDRKLSRVRVIRLRELPHESDGEQEPSTSPTGRRAPDHRTLVGPFWRWQACGKNWSERRLTFIAPFIRGPKDKPLHVPEKVNAWVR